MFGSGLLCNDPNVAIIETDIHCFFFLIHLFIYFFFFAFSLSVGLVLDWIRWHANCFPQHLCNLIAQLMGQRKGGRGKDVA